MILKHYLELLQWYRWHVAFIIVFSTVAFGFAGYYQRETAPEYTAAASVLLIPSEAELEFGLAGATRRAGIQTMSETYMEYVKSRPVIETALQKIDAATQSLEDEEQTPPPNDNASSRFVGLAKTFLSDWKRKLTEFDTGTYVEFPEEQRRVARIQNAITVRNVASTHILQIEVTLDDPEYAALVANTLAEAYVERVAQETNSDATELEGYLLDQIAQKEMKIQELREEKARLDERYGLGNIYVSSIEDQQRVEETQLAELHSRLLTVNLSRASRTTSQARLVEPAVAPAYVSSPGILSMTQIGLLIGFVLAAASVVIRDAITDTVKTSADLHRLVGNRSIGLLPRSRLRFLPPGATKSFGKLVQQHFALARLSEPGGKKSSKSRALTPAQSEQQGNTLVIEGDFEELEEGQQDFWTRLNNMAKVRRVPHEPVPAEEPNHSYFARITGLAPAETLCRATIHIAAGMARMGASVYCKLPEGVMKRPPTLRFRGAGQVTYAAPDKEDASDSEDIIIECLEPMNSKFRVNASEEWDPGTPLICVLPQDQIPESVVETMTENLQNAEFRNWHFLLMSSTKRL